MDIKKQILKWVKEVENYKKTNPECKESLKIMRETGDKIGEIYPKIHNEQYSSQDEVNDMMMQISLLAQEKREAENIYKALMKEKFPEFKKKYENIYDLATSEEGIDPQTLKHVLAVYTQLKDKKISEAQGMNRGVDYMKKKFNLPDDFLNYVPE